jgi:hypothetical protein
VAQSERQIAVYRDELGTPLLSQLSDAERAELRTLAEREKVLLKEIESSENELLQITQERDLIKADLRSNLYKRRDNLQNKLSLVGGFVSMTVTTGAASRRKSSSSSSNSSSESAERSDDRDLAAELLLIQSERVHIDKLLAALDVEMSELDASIILKKAEVNELEIGLEQSKASELEAQGAMTEATKVK